MPLSCRGITMKIVCDKNSSERHAESGSNNEFSFLSSSLKIIIKFMFFSFNKYLCCRAGIRGGNKNEAYDSDATRSSKVESVRAMPAVKWCAHERFKWPELFFIETEKKSLPWGREKMQHCRTFSVLALVRIRLRLTFPIHFNDHIERVDIKMTINNRALFILYHFHDNGEEN